MSIAGRAKSRGNTRRKSTLPVLIHRLTDTDVLPTIHEEAEVQDSDNGEDGTPTTQAFGERNAPNAVEVLAQICRETVETAVEQFEN
ncbi:MAG: hypothetical protein M1823_008568, partial [Watsoniomyces obsoletus]